jgi:CheY-like chemotaxis protein
MPSPSERSRTILIVDDNLDLRDTLADLLTLAGYPVACASNGREALDYLRSSPPPRLILLDLKMPVMTGWQFRALQLQDPALAAIPVLVLSGGADIRDEVQGLDADAYIPKPANIDLLLTAIAPYFR